MTPKKHGCFDQINKKSGFHFIQYFIKCKDSAGILFSFEIQPRLQ